MTTPETPPAITANPRLGAWLTVGDGLAEIHVGKVELGQGILTALAQVAADALGLPMSSIRMVAAQTGHGPDQGVTAGSLSILQTAPALRHVGGVVRALTGGPAAEDYLEQVAALDPSTDLTRLIPAPLGVPRYVGRSEPRLDLPDKVLGRPRFISDLRPAGLLHGRVLRPPSPGAVLLDAPRHLNRVRVVRDGSFLGLVGAREAEVDGALEVLRKRSIWKEHATLPDENDLVGWLQAQETEHLPVVDGPASARISASYSKPYLAHASIAPSAGLARWDDDALHVWSHSQGIGPLRLAIVQALGLEPGRVVVEHVENAGCYGHNGADDAAFDAVLLARAVPGSPVLTRWSRADELSWGPLSPASTGTVRADLEDGRITGWTYDVVSCGHLSRPGYRGSPGLLAAAHLAVPHPLPPPAEPPLANGGGITRNARPIYEVGRLRIAGHRVLETPLRTSSMRSLGAYFNVFAIESFMDELALVTGQDPVEFRLAHLSDPRARAVIEKAAAASGWGSEHPERRGRGIGFARYKDKGAYCAVVAEVEAESEIIVRRLTVAADVGLVVSPDGTANQLEGGAVQSVSWTTKERVRFDRHRISSATWETYPILRFGEVPDVSVHLVESGAPSAGAGEAAQGPTAAALANAVAAATGVRVRDLPLTREAVVAAIDAM